MVERISTGIAGLDEISEGGLLSQKTYMINGGPGSGKTTLCLHFLAQNPEEDALYVTFDKNTRVIRWFAESLGLMTSNLHFEDLSPRDIDEELQSSFDVIPSSELGLGPMLKKICEAVDRHKPRRVVIEPMSTLLYLSPDSYQFRRQCQALFNYITDAGATVIFTSEAGSASQQNNTGGDLQFICDGVIELQNMREGRSISVTKFRGSGYSEGAHFMRLTSHGMAVYPRLIPEDHVREFRRETVSSEIDEIDKLLHGGIDRGTVTILSGPSGVGKTTLGMQFVRAAARRDERSVVYSFEESSQTMLHRCRAIKMPVDDMIDDGALKIRNIEPMLYSPDELALSVRREVEERGVKTVMLDSSSGYRLSVSKLSVAGEDIVERLHALCRYLVGVGVTVIIVNETHTISSDNVQPTELGISHLGDTLILMRYLEVEGEVRKTIGVLKKRTGNFEKSLREFEISDDGIKVGAPLRHLQGILRGLPSNYSTK
ncbi:ATPase domain-containing protein [Marinobacter fonticola]|uniref:ATPase domain-containing protein n=1 Tax=Marinobacter fonticola TaxID=2603215 RepID=UPI0011E690AE|nr:ATPase domain-containing protein [Marinobacter fonticola]